MISVKGVKEERIKKRKGSEGEKLLVTKEPEIGDSREFLERYIEKVFGSVL